MEDRNEDFSELIKNKDEEVWNEIAAEALKYASRTFTGYLQSVGAEDIAIEACSILFKGIKKGNIEVKTKQEVSYKLWEIVRNLAIERKNDHLPYKSHKNQQSINTLNTSLKELIGSKEEISDNTERVFAIDKLSEILNTLNEIDKTIITMKINGSTYEQISGELGISRTEAKQRYYRATKRIKDLVKATYEHE